MRGRLPAPLSKFRSADSSSCRYFASGSTVAPYSGEGGPFELVRSNSPLLFATLVAIGARILSRVQTLEIASAEALRLAELDFHPAKASSLWDLKALVLLGLYFGSPLLVPRIVALATEHRLPEAFSDLMDEREKSEVEEAALIEKGRLALMIWTYERWCVSPFFVFEDARSSHSLCAATRLCEASLR